MAPHKKFNKPGQYSSLGRGLDALIQTEEINTQGSSSISEIEINKIAPNPNQPRREMDEEALQELADSISQLGIIQPITLRQMSDGTYQIIAGERRWRASQKAGLTTIPAYVKTASDENVMQMALVENIQREDLNAIEIALAYNNLMEQGNMTQEQVSEKVGKKRTTVANYLRLLKLPASVQLSLRNKEIDQGHARALLSLPDAASQIKIFKEIKKKGASVREVEDMVRKYVSGDESTPRNKSGKDNNRSQEYDALKKHLSNYFQQKVQLTVSPSGKGRISIPFNSHDELEQLMHLFDNMK